MMHADSDKFSQQPGGTALEQNVVKESFQQKHLQAKISCIEATEPTLALLQKLPACNRVGERFDVVISLDVKGVQRCQGCRTVLNVAGFMAEADLVGETLKVTETLPNANGLTEGAVAIHNEELRMLPFLSTLDDAITGNGNTNGIGPSSWVWETLADGGTKYVIALYNHRSTVATTSHGLIDRSMVKVKRAKRVGIVCACMAVELRGTCSA
mmetsp:Transcript_26968/g.77780  ORF Transcript_26968/g.77780 Transcript_26968/m.77780 type:complete len:212 (+) Transcript_26968:2288-2923(+)